jgi:hypothetical protein
MNKVDRNGRRNVEDKDKVILMVYHVSFRGHVLEDGGSITCMKN